MYIIVGALVLRNKNNLLNGLCGIGRNIYVLFLYVSYSVDRKEVICLCFLKLLVAVYFTDLVKLKEYLI